MQNTKQQHTTATTPHAHADLFHGAAVILENGQEVPISEEMIQQACDELEKQWVKRDITEPK